MPMGISKLPMNTFQVHEPFVSENASAGSAYALTRRDTRTMKPIGNKRGATNYWTLHEPDHFSMNDHFFEVIDSHFFLVTRGIDRLDKFSVQPGWSVLMFFGGSCKIPAKDVKP